MKKILLYLAFFIQSTTVQAMTDNDKDVMFQDLNEMIIWDDVKEAKLPYHDMLDTLFQKCHEEGIKKFRLDALTTMLASTIHEKGWYNVLREYNSDQDPNPDFALLTFLCQGNYAMLDKYHNTMLHALVLEPSNLPAVEFVCNQLGPTTDACKAIVNAQNLVGESPLHCACRAKSITIAQYLISLPCIQRDLINHFGRTPRNIAAESDLDALIFLETSPD